MGPDRTGTHVAGTAPQGPETASTKVAGVSRFNCVVQADSAAHQSAPELERRLSAHHALHYPDENATVSWRPVHAGFMYTEGRQSTSSVISCALGHHTTRDFREEYMRGVCELWTEITGCTDHEIVVSITEVVPETEN